MFRLLALVGAIFSFSLATPGHAQTAQVVPSAGLDTRAPDFHGMLDAIGIYELLAIMANENAQGAADLEQELFPGRGGAAWVAISTRMHTTDRIVALFEGALNLDAMTPGQVAAVTDFFTGDVGARVVAGELAARRAYLDPEIEQAASDLLMDAVENGDERLVLLEAFNAANDLVDRNVTAALNASFAFYRGLAEGGAFNVEIPEDMMIAEVWGQETEVRRSTVEWLYGYQLTAYAEISNEDFADYIALSETEAGIALNTAMFQAFETVFTQLSFELGQAAAGFMATDDI